MRRAKIAASRLVSRRGLLQATVGAAAAASATRLPFSPALAASVAASDPVLRALEEKIEAGMARYHIPGVAVGVLYQGREHVRGYGVTNIDYPQPVDGDTLFRIGSTTKTFTGTVLMRLVEQGKLDLNAPVRRYLPGLHLADESVAARVTVRQLLNHSAGWLGDVLAGNARGGDALAKYVAAMQQLPQLTPLGQVFGYNNAAANLAGYLVETVSGRPYEHVVQDLLLDPLELRHTGFFNDTLVGYNLAASHSANDGQVKVQPAMWQFPQALNPTGGLMSSARDQLRYARFHLGDGTAPDGTPVLMPSSLRAMRSELGPGGTIRVEIDGVGISWWQRRTAEGVPVYMHGGNWDGQSSGFFFVPERGFAMTLFTNSTGGPKLITDLFLTDWALRQFAGLSDPPAAPRRLAPAQLAAYEGTYRNLFIPPFDAAPVVNTFELKAANGGLDATGEDTLTLAFYRDDFVLATDTSGQQLRADFVRGPQGQIAWFRNSGRLYAREG